QRTDDDTDRDGVNAEERVAELREQDDHEVVDERCGRAREKLAIRVQDPRRKRGEPHEDGRQQHDAREVNGQRDLLRVVEWRDERRDHIWRRDPHDDREPDEEDQDRIHDTGGDVPCFVLALPREIAREYRDERGRERPRDHEAKDGVGDLERRPERIELGRLAEVRPDHRQAQPAEDPTCDEGDDHDRRGARDRHRQRSDFEASGIVRIYAGKEAQALRSQTHPPDGASYLDAYGRPIRGADRRAYGPRRHRQRRREGRRDDLGRGERPRQGRKTRLHSQEQRPASAQPDRESRDEGEEEDLIPPGQSIRTGLPPTALKRTDSMSPAITPSRPFQTTSWALGAATLSAPAKKMPMPAPTPAPRTFGPLAFMRYRSCQVAPGSA